MEGKMKIKIRKREKMTGLRGSIWGQERKGNLEGKHYERIKSIYVF